MARPLRAALCLPALCLSTLTARSGALPGRKAAPSGSGLAQSCWAKYHVDNRNTGYCPIRPQPPAGIWRFPVAAGAFPGPSLTQGGFALFGPDVLHVVGAQDGVQRWQLGDQVNGNVLSGPGGLLYLCTGGAVACVSPVTGAEVWRSTVGANFYATPALSASGMLYACEASGTLYALSAQAGQVVWKRSLGQWSMCSPAVGESGAVYAAGNPGRLFKLNGQTGAVIWSAALPADSVSPPSLSGKLVILGYGARKGSTGGCVALDRLSGQPVWNFPCSGMVYTAPVIEPRGGVYIGSFNGTAYCLDAATGKPRWEFKTGGYVEGTPALSPSGTLYVPSSDHALYALNGQTGKELWSYQTRGILVDAPAVDGNGTVYFGSYDGYYYAIPDSVQKRLAAEFAARGSATAPRATPPRRGRRQPRTGRRVP